MRTHSSETGDSDKVPDEVDGRDEITGGRWKLSQAVYDNSLAHQPDRSETGCRCLFPLCDLIRRAEG